MAKVTPIIHLKPNMSSDEMLSYPVVSIDGVPFAGMHGKWMLVGMGFLGGIMEPFTNYNMLEKASNCTDLAVLPDLEGNTIIVIKGCKALVDKFA